LEELLGQGAFAEVWRARNLRTQKDVALKIFRAHSGPHWLFLQREVERLSLLDKHPHIVSLLDADLAADPPYYAMDLHKQGSLDKWLDPDQPLEPERAARWMEEVCLALSYVHSKGLMHCDLKPANLLLDDEDHVRVMDFGHSRILTASAGTLGTFFYMAPEQTLLLDPARQLQPDLRWDVFAVGASFFALLSGRTPWGRLSDKLNALPHLQDKLALLRQTIHDQPLPDLHKLSKGRVDRDLAAIVGKCCEDDPAKRYNSVNEILADLKARREGWPVSPLLQDKAYRSLKLLKRNRSAVGVAVVGLAILLGALGLRELQARRALKAQVAQLYSLRASERARAGDPLSAAAYEAAAYDASPSQASAWNLQYYLPSPPQSLFRIRRGTRPEFTPDGEKLLALRHDGDLALLNLKSGLPERDFEGPDSIDVARLSPDGRLAAGASADAKLRIWDLGSGKALTPWLRCSEPASALAWSPDGKLLAAAGAGGKLQFFALAEGGKQSAGFQLAGAVRRLDFSPDGKTLLSLSRYKNPGTEILELIDPQPKPQRRLQLALPQEGAQPRFTRSGAGLAVLGTTGGAWFLRRQRGFFGPGAWALRDSIPAPAKAPRWAAVSVDGRYLGRVEDDGRLRVWDLEEGATGSRPLHVMVKGPQRWGSFAPVGPGLATLSGEGELRLWNLATRQPTVKPVTLAPGAQRVQLTGEGRALVFSPPFARQWDLAKGEPVGRAFYHEAGLETLTGPKGQWLLQFPDEAPGELLAYKASRPDSYPLDYAYRRMPASAAGGAALSPEGKIVFTYWGRSGRFWDLDAGKALGREIRAGGTLSGASFSPDGRFALLQAAGGNGQVYDMKQDAALYASLAWKAPAVAAAFRPDSTLLTADAKGQLAFWDLKAGTLQPRPGPQHPGLQALAFSADGKTLRGLAAQTLLDLDPKSGALLKTRELPGNYQRFILGPGGETYLSLFGSELRLWDARSGAPLAAPVLAEAEPAGAALSADRKVLAVAFKDGGFRLLDAATGRPLGARFPGNGSSALNFSQDPRQLAVGSANGFNRVWILPWLSRKHPRDLFRRALAATHMRLDEDGALQPLSYSQWKDAWRRSRDEATP
jgi:WD40 repeat protein